MRILLLLPLLLASAPAPQNGPAADAESPVAVLAFKWTRSRQTIRKTEETGGAPAAAMTRADKNFERNRRINDPAGMMDPNEHNIDTRSAALEKAVRQSRSPKSREVDAFTYLARLRNTGAKAIEVVFWEYRFTESANPTNVTRHQFLCGAQVRPGKEKELRADSLSAPSGAVSAASLGDKPEDAFAESVVVNRVEYADGAIWQRRGWSFAEVRSAVERATATPWGAEMCREL